MLSTIIDTHAHLDSSAFDEDRTGVIARARDAGVNTIITVATDLDSTRQAIKLAEEFPGVFAAAGFHPHDVARMKKADLAELETLARHPRVVAIGEIGLDFYRDYSPRTAQLEAFKFQLELAAGMGLPVIIHCRQAEEDVLRLLGDWIERYGDRRRESPGVIHCFSGDGDTAGRYLDMGFYLSLGGNIGYPSAKNTHEVIRSIPEDRLLVETDCPFLPPQRHRGQRNEPAYLRLTVETLAEIRGETPASVAEKTTRNARRLFRLPEIQ